MKILSHHVFRLRYVPPASVHFHHSRLTIEYFLYSSGRRHARIPFKTATKSNDRSVEIQCLSREIWPTTALYLGKRSYKVGLRSSTIYHCTFGPQKMQVQILEISPGGHKQVVYSTAAKPEMAALEPWEWSRNCGYKYTKSEQSIQSGGPPFQKHMIIMRQAPVNKQRFLLQRPSNPVIILLVGENRDCGVRR